MSEPNYQESEITGTQWVRARRVVIDNPYQENPSITFIEERAIQLGNKVITEIVDNISCTFDPNSELHTEIYLKLNELYVLVRSERDSIIE